MTRQSGRAESRPFSRRARRQGLAAVPRRKCRVRGRGPTLTRMQRSSTGTIGLRMNTSRAAGPASPSARRRRRRRSRSSRNWSPIRSAARPLSRAMPAMRSRPAATLATTSAQIGLVGKRGLAGDLRHAADAVMVAHLLEVGDHLPLADGIAAANAGQPVGLGECPHAQDVRPVDRRSAAAPNPARSRHRPRRGPASWSPARPSTKRRRSPASHHVPIGLSGLER